MLHIGGIGVIATVTLSFKLELHDKELVNDTLDEIKNRTGKNKGEALVHIIHKFNQELIKGKTIGNDYTPPNVRQVLTSIGCDYLTFLNQELYCLEKAAKTKKPILLDGTPQEVEIICRSCLKFREEETIKELERYQRREYVKRFNAFAKNFMRIGEKGIMTDVWFCIHNRLDGNLIFSRDGSTIYCPLEDDELVFIQEKCQTLLNPKDGSPPCQYLTKTDVRLMLDKEVWEKEGLTVPVLEEIELEEKPRQVDADFKEIEEE